MERIYKFREKYPNEVVNIKEFLSRQKLIGD